MTLINFDASRIRRRWPGEQADSEFLAVCSRRYILESKKAVSIASIACANTV
jgi:hypothetical protein